MDRVQSTAVELFSSCIPHIDSHREEEKVQNRLVDSVEWNLNIFKH